MNGKKKKKEKNSRTEQAELEMTSKVGLGD